MEHDPQEDDPVTGPIIERVFRETLVSLADHPMKGKPGFGHIVSGRVKATLKEKHGIDWLTATELNPDVHFD